MKWAVNKIIFFYYLPAPFSALQKYFPASLLDMLIILVKQGSFFFNWIYIIKNEDISLYIQCPAVPPSLTWSEMLVEECSSLKGSTIFYIETYKQDVWINLLNWNDFTDWNEKKIMEYDFCPHREYLVVVSHKVKSFQ